MKTKKKVFNPKKKWKNCFYIDIYRLAASGLNDGEIAKSLGVSGPRFSNWRTRKPTVRYALDQGREKTAKGSAMKSYMDYVYDRMPDDLQELWGKISACDDESPVSAIEAMLQEKGKYARMHLFLMALTTYNFNPSKAMKAVNITRKQLDKWIEDEPDFSRLIQEMHEHKKNFAEEALMKLVKRGDSNATIFVNKTLNKDRGYVDKTTIEHTGEIKHTHSHRLINLDKLNLPFEIRKAILVAVREQRETIEGTVVPNLTYVPQETNGKKRKHKEK